MPHSKPAADLADVLVEAAEAGDRRVGDDRPVADQADPRAPGDLPLGDERPGDRADLRRPEGLADLDLAERVLDLLGVEHALHRGAELLDRLVDHRVAADLDALAVGERPGVADRAGR